MSENPFHHIPQPDWRGVRALYKKLSEEFNILTSAYNLTIDAERQLMLDHLILVIDEVDKCVDELPTKSQRDDVTIALINFLKNESQSLSHPLISESLARKMLNIKHVVHKRGIVDVFVAAAERIFHFTEVKRHALNRNEMIDYIKKEGASTAILPLSVLGVPTNHPFGVFFTRLCMLMGIADLVFDARADYKLGYIAYKPDLALYLSLNKILIKEGWLLLSRFPKKFQFLWYCIKFTIALIREENNFSKPL